MQHEPGPKAAGHGSVDAHLLGPIILLLIVPFALTAQIGFQLEEPTEPFIRLLSIDLPDVIQFSL